MYPYSSYQNQLQNQFMSPQTPAVQYVNGRQSADNYSMMPNSSVILMDSNIDRFYLKKADASGSCTIKEYDFHEVEDKSVPEYVTREEFEELKEMIKENKNEQHYERQSRIVTASEPGTNIVG